MDTLLLFKIAGIGIAVALLVAVLKQAGRDDIGQMVTLVGVLTVLLMTAQLLFQFFRMVNFTFLNQ